MRIAIVTTQFPVLSETFVSNKVKALAARGHVVRVFTAKKNNALYTQLFADNHSVSVAALTIKNALLYIALHPTQLLKSAKKKIPKSIHFKRTGSTKLIALNRISFILNFRV